MQAIREILEVKDNKIEIDLPENFSSDKVEVIVLSYNEKNDCNSDVIWKKELLSISAWDVEDCVKVDSWKIEEF